MGRIPVRTQYMTYDEMARGIILEGWLDDQALPYHEIFLPHWVQFCHALRQYDITFAHLVQVRPRREGFC